MIRKMMEGWGEEGEGGEVVRCGFEERSEGVESEGGR